MKNRLPKKSVSLILCLIMLVSVFVSCKDEDTGTSDTNTPTTNAPSVGGGDEFDINDIISSESYKMVVVDGATDYVIVYPAGSDDAKAAAEALQAKIEMDTGAVMEVVDDSVAEKEKEILIGATNRTADDGILDGVRYNDYIVKAVGNKLVADAYTSDCLEMAWKRVIIALNVTECDGKLYAYYEADYSYRREAQYTPDSLTVNGKSISEYVIVYGNDDDLSVAEYVQLMVGSACGDMLPIKKSTNASEAAANEIVIGVNTGREAAVIETENTYEVKTVGDTLVFYYTNLRAGKHSVDEYEDKLGKLIDDSNRATTVEIKELAIGGKVSAVSAGDVLYSQNFNNVALTADTSTALSSLGWRVVYQNNWGFSDKILTQVVEKSAGDNAGKLNGGYSMYEIAPASLTANVDKVTIQMDLKFEGDFLNFVILYGGVVEGNNYTAINAATRSIGLYSTTTTDGTASHSMASGSKEKANNLGACIVTANKTIVDKSSVSSELKLTDINKYVIEIDAENNTVKLSVYAQGATEPGLVLVDNEYTPTNSGLYLRAQGADTTIDNVVISAGTYAEYTAAQN